MTDCDHTDGADLVEPDEAENPWPFVSEDDSGPKKSGFTCTYKCAECGEVVVWVYRPTEITDEHANVIWETEYGDDDG